MSKAGGVNVLQPPHLCSLLWEAPHLELNTKKQKKTLLIFFS
jgi:hypothetical protein